MVHRLRGDLLNVTAQNYCAGVIDEARELDAERLYERAIHLAREQGFVQNEGLAYQLASRFYAARGFEMFADAYLRAARQCYVRWGALGKVKHIDRLHPRTQEEMPQRNTISTITATVDDLDLAKILRVSQAVSGEMVLEKVIDSLMRSAIEHAGAERGLMLLTRGAEQRIVAEATTRRETVVVQLRDAIAKPPALPASVVKYVSRTQEYVILDDALTENQFSFDTYISEKRARSILRLPLLNRGKLIAVLYLENNLTPHVFTPARIAVLKLLASQAAISLENAHSIVILQNANCVSAVSSRRISSEYTSGMSQGRLRKLTTLFYDFWAMTEMICFRAEYNGPISRQANGEPMTNGR
jgi:GAF domain-containing protein